MPSRQRKYEIQSTPASGRDVSFAACVLSLLAFLAICVVIILTSVPWQSEPTENHGHTTGYQDSFVGNDEQQLRANDTISTPHSEEERAVPTSSGPHTTSTSGTPPAEHRSTTSHATYEIGEVVFNDPIDDMMQGPDNVCETGECKNIASHMLSLINHSVEPCHDFYQYACGGARSNKVSSLWTLDNDEEVNQKILAAMDKMQQSANTSTMYREFINFYNLCLSYDVKVPYANRIKQAQDILKELGSFHDKNSWEQNKSTLSLTKLLSQLFQINSAPLFDISKDAASTGRGHFSLRLTPPKDASILMDFTRGSQDSTSTMCFEKSHHNGSKIINLDESYRKYLNCKRNNEHFLKRMKLALTSLGAFEWMTERNRSVQLSQIFQTVEFLLTIKQQHLPNNGELHRTLLAKDYVLINISELQDKYSLVDWSALIRTLLNSSDVVPADTSIQLYFDNFFTNLFDELDMLDPRELHNTLLGIIAHELFESLVRNQTACNRPQLCLKSAKELMEDTALLLYQSSYTPREIVRYKKEVLLMFNMTKTTLKQNLENAQWLTDDHHTKTHLLDKLNGMEIHLGTADLNSYSSRNLVQVSSNANFFELFMFRQRLFRQQMYSNYITEPNGRYLWSQFSDFSKTSGGYAYGMNSIFIPPTIYLSFFHHDVPKYIQFATVGSIIAHGVAHHFDTVGINYGPTGKKEAFNFPGKSRHFQFMQECAQHQYDFKKTYESPDGHLVQYKVDSKLILNEQLSDQMALELSLDSYLSWLLLDEQHDQQLPWISDSWDQAFFLAHAQMHCSNRNILDYRVSLYESERLPPFLRVNNMMSNIVKFSEAFKCQSTHQMNPQYKCAAFPNLEEI